MFVNEELNNSKSNYSSNNFPLYFSPYIHKKKSIGNLYTEPRKIPIEKDSNSRNKSKQKANYSIKISNSNIKSQQDSLTKSLKLIQDKNKKGRNMHHQSYMKINFIRNISLVSFFAKIIGNILLESEEFIL